MAQKGISRACYAYKHSTCREDKSPNCQCYCHRRVPEERPSLPETMLELVNALAKRSTCTRGKTACVITDDDGRILVSGYNGSPSGLDHCTLVGCLLDGGNRCIRAAHAEANAIALAAKYGVRLEGTTLWSSHRPCVNCTVLILSAGVRRVMWWTPYESDGQERTVETWFSQSEVEYAQLV